MSETISTPIQLFKLVASGKSVNLYKLLKTYIYTKYNPLGLSDESKFWILLEDYKNAEKESGSSGRVTISKKYAEAKIKEFLECRKAKLGDYRVRDIRDIYLVDDIYDDGKEIGCVVFDQFIDQKEIDEIKRKEEFERKIYFADYCDKVFERVVAKINESLANITQADLDQLYKIKGDLNVPENAPSGLLEKDGGGVYHMKKVVFDDEYSGHDTFFNSNDDNGIIRFRRSFGEKDKKQESTDRKLKEDSKKLEESWAGLEEDFCKRFVDLFSSDTW